MRITELLNMLVTIKDPLQLHLYLQENPEALDLIEQNQTLFKGMMGIFIEDIGDFQVFTIKNKHFEHDFIWSHLTGELCLFNMTTEI